MKSEYKCINIIFSNFYGEINAANNRLNSFIKVLLSNNYKVNLISNSLHQQGVENYENLTIYYIKQEQFNKKNFFKRAYQEILISYKLIKFAKQLESDYTFITIPSMFLLPFGKNLKNNIIDIRDIQWEYLNNKLIRNFLKNIMLKSLKNYEKIIVTNDYEMEYFKSYLPIIIYNGIEKSKYDKIINLDYKLKNEVTYIGNIGIAQDVLTLVKVAEKLPKIKFNIIGDGAEFNNIKDYVNKNRLKNVNLTGKLNWEEILKYYQNSKILFAQLKENFAMAMPSKLYEYASTGLPIVYGGKGEAVKFVKKLENGYIFEPGNVEKCKSFIRTILEKKVEISFKNRELVKHKFIREKNVRNLLTILEELQ
jgi:glycosyltransferase involved in cell wall biosynthesis